MNVLVLGASGFIGKNLIDFLLKSNSYCISTYDRIQADACNGTNIKHWIGDFTTENRWGEILKDIDVCFHLISTSLPGKSNENMVADIEGNLIGTIGLLDALKGKKVKIIYASSGGTVYGNLDKNQISEDDLTNPIVSYGIVKLSIEKYLFMYHLLHGFNVHVFRISNPYGAGHNLASGQGVIPIFVDRILNSKEITIWGDGSVVRDYIYISDLLNAFELSLQSDKPYLLLNIGSGKGYSLIEVISLIESALGVSANLAFFPARNFDVQRSVLNIEKAKKELGWFPKVELRDGIDSYLASKH